MPRIVGVVCLLGVIVWQLVTPEYWGTAGGTQSPRYVGSGYSREQIQRLANGEPGNPPGRFSKDVYEQIEPRVAASLPGRTGVYVGFLRPASIREFERAIGWPATMARVTRAGAYANALTGEGFQPSRIDPQLRPMGHWEVNGELPRAKPRTLAYLDANQLVVRPDPNQTGGWDVQVYFDVGALALNVAVWLALVWMLAAARRWWDRRRLREACTRRWWSGRLGMLVLAAALLLLSGVVLGSGTMTVRPSASRLRQVNLPSLRIYFEDDRVAPTHLDAVGLRDIAGTSQGDKAIAAEILRVCTRPDEQGEVLVVTPVSEFLSDGHGEPSITFGSAIPFFAVDRYDWCRRPDFPFPEAAPSTSGSIQTWRNTVSLLLPGQRTVRANGDVATTKYVIYLASVGMLILAAAGAWAITRAVTRTWCWWKHGRWIKAGRCAVCGYSLERLPARPQPS